MGLYDSKWKWEAKLKFKKMNSRRPTFISVGNAITDVISFSNEKFLIENGMTKNAMNLIDYKRSEEIDTLILKPSIVAGGSAANTAACLSKFNCFSNFIGRVGRDKYGHNYKKNLEEQLVETKLVNDVNLPTARSYIFVTPDKNRTMNTYLGASINMHPSDIPEYLIKSADLVYVEGYLYDAPKGPECWRKIGELSKKYGTKVAISLSDSWCVDRHREKLKNFIKNYADVVVCNNEELKLMFGGSFDSAISQLQKIVRGGSVTDGKNGALAFYENEIKRIEAFNKDNIIDTTGAGDFFAAGYIFGQLLTSDLSISLELGSMLAADAIKQIGASPNENITRQVFRRYPKFALQ